LFVLGIDVIMALKQKTRCCGTTQLQHVDRKFDLSILWSSGKIQSIWFWLLTDYFQ